MYVAYCSVKQKLMISVWSLLNLYYTVSQKTSHLCFAITLTHMNVILIFFVRNVTDKVSNQKTLYCATSNNVLL